MAKLLLLDGNSLTYRAFYAVPDHMANSAGEVTNAVFGFSSMLASLIRDQRPDGIAVCFDRPEPTFRHERQPAYKAQRDRAPEDLIRQLQVVRRLLEAMKVPAVDLAGFEADDLLATLATAAQTNGDDAVVVSGDRDTFQLPQDPHIQVLYTLRGVSEYVLLDEKGVAEKVGVSPGLYTQYAAMRGDKSDNLPGVPGVGEKTAAKLLTDYGDLDGIFANLDDLTPKLRENLAENEALARENLSLMTLRTDVPIDKAQVNIKDLRWQQSDVAALVKIFAELEFSDMHKRLVDAAVGTALEGLIGDAGAGAGSGAADLSAVIAPELKIIAPKTAADALKHLTGITDTAVGYRLKPADAVLADAVLASAAAGGGPELADLALVLDLKPGGSKSSAAPKKITVLCLSADLLAAKQVKSGLKKLFERRKPLVAVHHAKKLMAALKSMGISLNALGIDTQVAAYLVDPATSKKELDELLLRFCRMALPELAEPAQGVLNIPDDPATAQANTEQLGAQALAVSQLAPVLSGSLEELEMTSLYTEIERPLIAVLQKMETRGVGVDSAELTAFGKELGKEATKLAMKITKAAGREFNINSPKELGKVLFGDLGLTAGKRTQSGGYSTNAATLEAIRSEHEIVDLVLRYRETTKLQSTCEKTLLGEIAPDGRIHAVFHQTVSRTGRLSSEHPNLHAIPVRAEHGKRVRRAFVPSDGFELLVADYDQIELRVVAHLSEDPGLVAMFASGEDVHRATAAAVFGVGPDKVTSDMRNKAKMVSYGLIYGMEAFGLGQRLGIETGEAAKILDAYFDAFSGVRDFMTRVVEESRERGYTETVFGRRRPIPELNARNHQVRRAAERQAMNAPVQGLAADIFKIALVHLDAALEAKKTESSLILQVHDEVILEVTPAERDDIRELTAATMRDAVALSVPLEVDIGIGATWADAKG